MVINEHEAQTVRLCFFMYLFGYSTSEIVETMVKLGRKTKRGNEKWTASTVLGILQNERHCGDVLARKTFTPNYLDHKSKKNKHDRNQYRQKDHHEAMDYAERNINRLPLPDTDKMAYLEDSFEIDKEGLCCDEAGKIIMDTES